jgi:predicted transcriptional regulator
MTASTTLKLPENLKKRIVPLANSAGKTPHAWMVEALETQAILAEKRKMFVAAAVAADKEVERTGLVHDAEDVFAYLTDKLAGKKPKRPRSVRL